MPTPDLTSLLQRLLLAYPEKRLDGATLQVYQQELSDIPLGWLGRAVTHHIHTSPWFPHISDLRLAAHKLAGSPSFTSLPASGTDFLALEFRQLEHQYFHDGVFDLAAWEKLAAQLERVGRPYKAEELRQKARHIQEAEQAYQRGEDYPPAEVRQHYRDCLGAS
jgi:hypothetical protein